MSEDCRDLLIRILEFEQSKRITLEEIKKHPWYTQKLPAQYEEALRSMKHEQAMMDMAANGARDPLKMRKRAQRLKLIVQVIPIPTSMGALI